MSDIDDPIRPNEPTFRAMYERGYSTWYNLYQTPNDAQLPSRCLDQLRIAFPHHPRLPNNLALSGSNIAVGKSRWRTTSGPCSLSSYEEEFQILIASSEPTIINIADTETGMSVFPFPKWFDEQDNHITVLILAWIYILSARWAELIPKACGPHYTDCQAEWNCQSSMPKNSTTYAANDVVDLGDIDDDAARWWGAVLALDSGWKTEISTPRGYTLHSPWYSKLVSRKSLVLSRNAEACPPHTQHDAPSFTDALRYFSDYCELYDINDQSQAALSAVLLLPTLRFYNLRQIKVPAPRFRSTVRRKYKRSESLVLWSQNLIQLDRLLAFSCNALGSKALLGSVFFEPDVPCNICGAWLQGTLAFLDSDVAKEPHTLASVLIERDPSLGFLWIGAFILGIHSRALQEARNAWWSIDLHVAAWTGTLVSFIQMGVSLLPPKATTVPRADELRLMYLGHELHHAVTPLYPWAPFGFTALSDCDLDVREHVQCRSSHGLQYAGFSWICQDGRCVVHEEPVPLTHSFREKKGQPNQVNISIPYDHLDFENDFRSAYVTQNIFCWLREMDGFPVAERAIREHEWVDNFYDEDDDGGPITGDIMSTAPCNLHGWLSKTTTWRSNSL